MEEQEHRLKKQDARAWLMILLVITILLSGCKKGDQGTAVPTQAAPTRTVSSAVESPLPSEDIQKTTPSDEDVYPSPGGAEESYPGPGEAGAGQGPESEGPYPQPGANPQQTSPAQAVNTATGFQAATRTLATTPTSTVQAAQPSPSRTTTSPAYPGPSFQATTPVPQGISPAGTPGSGGFTPSPTNIFGTMIPTATLGTFPGLTPVPTIGAPTPTGFPGQSPVPTVGAPTPTEFIYVVRPGLKATDPDTVSLASGRVQLIEFFAFWSLESQSMAPVVQRMEAKYKGDMKFSFLDVDDPSTKQFQHDLGYSLSIHPHFYLIDGQGNKLAEWTGIVSEGEFEQAIRQVVPGG